MGASGSKAARSVGVAQRQYPSRIPTTATTKATNPLEASSRPPLPRTQDPSISPDAKEGLNETSQIPESSTANSVVAPPPPRPQKQARDTREEGIDLDGRDPQLAAHLRTLGPVQPNPTYSPSSTSSPVNATADQSKSNEGNHGIPSGAPNAVSMDPTTTPSSRNNPALSILASRQRIQDEQESDKIDAGKKGFAGRRHVDVRTLKKALILRDERGMKGEEVEKALGLRKGFMDGLGRPGLFEAT